MPIIPNDTSVGLWTAVNKMKKVEKPKRNRVYIFAYGRKDAISMAARKELAKIIQKDCKDVIDYLLNP